jgi:DNA end-binding protein Ku
MPRAIWSGSISFGLLNVPVKLYSAVSRKNVSFRELREKDGSRIRHKRVAEADGEEVSYEDIVKGYEVAPEQYVVITRDELEEIDPKKTRAIEIQDFVDLDDIDPIYFDHPYYLGPDKGAEKAYALLVKAMGDAKKVAVACCETASTSPRSARPTTSSPWPRCASPTRSLPPASSARTSSPRTAASSTNARSTWPSS